MRRPPLLPRMLLRLLLRRSHREFILGDLDEEYAIRGRNRWWYWRQSLGSIYAEAEAALRSSPSYTPGSPRRGSMFESTWQDVKYAWRSLNRRPFFSAIAVITLALGIGANTGIFSIANWMLLRPVAGVGAQEDLAVVEFANRPGNSLGLDWTNFADMRSRLRSVDGIAAAAFTNLQISVPNQSARLVFAHAVGGDYFGLLRTRMRLGRSILSEETEPGTTTSVAVISERLWTELFDRDPAVVGRTLHANKSALTIVGVAGDHFRGLERRGDIDVWVPLSIFPQLDRFPPELLTQRGAGVRMRDVIVRLRPGTPIEATSTELRQVMTQLLQAHPQENELYAERETTVYAGIGLPVFVRERTQTLTRLLLMMVGALLVISSANVASMLLVRGLQQRGDAAMRRALGASFSRLASQQLAEALLLATLGGAIGLVVARAFLAFIEGGTLMGMPPIENVPLDTNVLAFAAIVTIVTGIVFALAPLSVLRKASLSSLTQAASTRFSSRTTIRDVITVVQVALSIVLLVGAVMLGRTMRNLQSVNLGFDPQRVTGFRLHPDAQGYVDDALPALRTRLVEAFNSRPEFEAAALTQSVPFSGMSWQNGVRDPQSNSDQHIRVQGVYVSDGYFAALGIPVLKGRPIERRDWTVDTAVTKVVLSESAARRLFGERDPIGRSLYRGRTTLRELIVIGVVPDTRTVRPDEPPPMTVYEPIHALPSRNLAMVVRPRGSVEAAEPAMRRVLAAIDPQLALDLMPLSDNIRDQLSEHRLMSALLWLFSALAVLLAAIGLYGVLAFSVGQRTREFGIRMAMGAQAERVLMLVATKSALLVLSGLLIGLAGAVWLSRIVQSLLFGVDRFDAVTYVTAALLFIAISAAASYLPARAAVRVSPLTALRHE